MNDRYCRQCGERFTPSRYDQWFHAPKCVAAWYRDNDNPGYVHAANYGEHLYTCEECGVDYFVNDYANRGGKRAPKYCSVNCKQKAYRKRSKNVQQQAQRRSSTPPPPPPPPPNSSAKSYAYTSRYDRFALAEAYRVLGLSDLSDMPAVHKAWRALMGKFHPDVNSAPDAKEKAQLINWAHDYVVKFRA